ncbi:MAG: tRNA (adenosine(37)-N6)-threonylcarbamoyltransferase complex transferase subunit TsaD [Magnetococcales bacterium]|nr:tRNA (adenosine(37)-N6)-threonylcarbamoyltransferase complex transferase subunit TsaD [Magnetococcales bacterium]MBF0157405.1 tRNA (adenosine(37)-N6)-threonylcarbamoyltransferase complex transferase subunit TsaD [Magnetococcales bacterium]
MRILGIETSCDETAAAVVALEGTLPEGRIHLLSNVVQGQLQIHADYGGVVPELASRAHIRHIHPVVSGALAQAGMEAGDLDGVAVTAGPGLVGGLLVGISLAKGLALAIRRPLIGVHHLEGHLVSPLLSRPEDVPPFPFVALLVSGGHTVLVHAREFGDYQLLGQTLDDAVGEAFDKGARMLGLGYPGGPAVAALAEGGNTEAVHFPRILLDRQRFDFSFSGLKTALRAQRQKDGEAGATPERLRDLAASYQEAIVDTLIFKALAACHHTGASRLVIAGGVGANRRLREKLSLQAREASLAPFFPALALCMDNGAMIAVAGAARLARGLSSDLSLDARPRWPLTELAPIRYHSGDDPG